MVVAEIPLWVIHHASSSDPPESLQLLQQQKKSAIYAIDVCQNRFATGGGDGTVRIWNAQALFHSKNKGGTFTNDDNYVSTSADEEESTVTNNNNDDNNDNDKPKDNHSSNQNNGLREEMIHDLSNVVRRKKDASSTTTHTAATNTTPIQQGIFPTAVAPTIVPHPSPKQQQRQDRLLCTLSAHTGSSVLAVRFSNNGNYLASAGDDGCVCIYTNNTASTNNVHQGFETSSAVVEQWTRILLCRGHNLDVVDLCWAPDDSHLVSCSLDSDTPIIVWNTANLEQSNARIANPYKILGRNEHNSNVKGVTFDPAGSYLASSGDDPAVCIWRAHDDWGLERRIDDGIFRKWKEDDTQALTSQSLFRRISWSTDGAFVCSTNSVVKNKHVASTISRDGWSTATNSSAAGAANLVGHKQPVVVSRHSPELLDARKQQEEEDEEPEYATLLALGDKRGFLTVWSTRKSRPIFKLQCSESRCTITDLAWGKLPSGDLLLLVSSLDGQVVALKFAVPDELGPLLTPQEKAKVFQLRYGIDLEQGNSAGKRGLFVGRNSGPKLIENALQMTLEDENTDKGEMDDMPMPDDDEIPPPANQLTPRSVKTSQKESEVQGKKRVQPVLMTTQPVQKRTKPVEDGKTKNTEAKDMDPLESAMNAAQRASAATKTSVTERGDQLPGNENLGDQSKAPKSPRRHHTPVHSAKQNIRHFTTFIPHSTSRVHAAELPLPEVRDILDIERPIVKVECKNAFRVPSGSTGGSVACIEISIAQNDKITWNDEVTGTVCSAVAACGKFLAVGTTDGVIQLYGTSPTLGWSSGQGFRSHPPLVFGSSIVTLHLYDEPQQDETSRMVTTMVVVTADGSFGVYRLQPHLSLLYKGSVLPAMMHMSAGIATGDDRPPKLSRIQITETGRLLLLLSLSSTESTTNNAANPSVGGSLQAFVYEPKAELWMRVADSRFILSDFYSMLPSSQTTTSGVLSRIDDMVRIGSMESALRPSQKGRLDRTTESIFNQATDESGNYIATRSHCEDRLACAISLKSASEFKHWLTCYARTLSMHGQEFLLRLLVDAVLGKSTGMTDEINSGNDQSLFCWWLSSAPDVLGMERNVLVKTSIVPEMSKNRALQRLTNEVTLELQHK